jgi:hypothetical protein
MEWWAGQTARLALSMSSNSSFSGDSPSGLTYAMVMAQMTAGWRCAGAFRPAAVALLHIIEGDVRVEFRDVRAALGQ